MLRALFILLAIVSSVLAFVLEMPGLYVAAGALVVIALVMLAVSAKKRHEKSKQSYLATSPSREHDEELAALGIADIRPRERTRSKKFEDEEVSVVGEPHLQNDRVDPRGAERKTAISEAGLEEVVDSDEDEVEVSSGNGAGATNPELRALGIMDIRPRERRPSSPILEAELSESRTGNNGGSAQVASASAQPKRKVEDPESPEAIANKERIRKEILTPYLQSLQSAIGANTVCLLRHDDDPLKYHIEAIVSKNAYARSQGHFRTRVPLLTPAIARRPVLTFRIGEKGLATSNLGYYLEPIAVKQIAVTDVPRKAESISYFLLADTMEEGGIASTRQHALLSQYARVLGTVLGGGDAVELNGERADYRPRRDIIEEEMTRARSAKEPLALILVYLNEAEAVAEEGEEAINEAEATLEGRLRELVEGRRMEHFGELVYGVFYAGEAAEVEPWVMSIQEQLLEESGPLAGGVSIGIAVLKDRHDDAEAFRADANAALREAFETGACTIVE